MYIRGATEMISGDPMVVVSGRPQIRTVIQEGGRGGLGGRHRYGGSGEAGSSGVGV